MHALRAAATIAGFFLLVPAPARAQSNGDSGARPDTYGTTTLSAVTVGSYAFQTRLNHDVFPGNGIDRYSEDFLHAMPALPNGALIEKIELRGCDNSAGGEVSLAIGTCPTPGVACNGFDDIHTGISQTPGCGVFQQTLSSPIAVDSTAPVLLTVATTSGGSLTTFSFARVFYRLQVSPAPLSQTFGDVPTGHLYFRAIEALAAAGITSGCGANNFCPGAAVTRGEMAKFLANALGLHFPN